MTDNTPTKPLDEIKDFARRFVVFADEAHYDLLALWVLHTYCIDAAYTTPYLYVNSSQPQSGKTRTLEVAMLLARNGFQNINATAATMFRRLADQEPTLFVDEVDLVFTGASNEDLRAILNGGYKRGNMVPRYTGKEVEDFPTFCPKMLVGIDNGSMPDTLRDRCIPMILKRKKTDQPVERMHWRIEPEAKQLQDRLRNWATTNIERVMDAPEPEYIEGISDRKFEIAEPLLVLALIAGGKQYAQKIRKEFARLLAGEAPKQSIGIRILEAAQEMFEASGATRLMVADLADKVGLTSKELGTELAKLDVASKPITVTSAGSRKVSRGYRKADFQDAWERYL